MIINPPCSVNQFTIAGLGVKKIQMTLRLNSPCKKNSFHKAHPQTSYKMEYIDMYSSSPCLSLGKITEMDLLWLL